MRGKGCFSQQLNAELENRSRIYCLSIGRFSSVGGQGKTTGFVGGNVRLGHWHGISSGPGTPVLEQGWALDIDIELRSAESPLLAARLQPPFDKDNAEQQNV